MIPTYCKDCTHLHTGGRPESKYARWCCRHSGDTQKKWKHCRENGGKDVDPQLPLAFAPRSDTI